MKNDIIMLRRTIRAALTALLIPIASSFALAQAPAAKSGYAPVNGLKLYYEAHGAGRPLILLHGGLGAGDMFTAILPSLAAGRQVITVDLQGHGRTADIDRPLTYEAMADDIAALVKHLGLERADVMGYSLGGGVALRTAIQHPEVVRKLVIVSAPFRRDGWYPEILAAMAQLGPAAADAMKPTPMYKLYSRVAPQPDDWPILLRKVSDMFKEDYDWSAEVSGLKTPTLLVFGDADAVRTAAAVEFFELLGRGKKDGGWDGSGVPPARLAILPGFAHYTIFSSPALVAAVTPFLDVENMGAAPTSH
jgi:pimeloyl-ACP methyl ester carboxylesterase